MLYKYLEFRFNTNNIKRYRDAGYFKEWVSNLTEDQLRYFEIEMNHLIFHTEPYTGANARTKMSWQYYFATPSIMHTINLNFNFSSI